jgi:hypothetical protein
MATNCLQSNFRVDIIVPIIQPKTVVFGDKLIRGVAETLDKLESWFSEAGKEKG